MTERSRAVARISWPSLQQKLRREWEQGQHANIIAPTRGGKTYLALKGLLPFWPFALVLDAKGEDKLLDTLAIKVPKYPPKPFRTAQYRIAPPYPKLRETMWEALERSWRDSTRAGGWTLYIDELRLFADSRNGYLNSRGVLGRMVERVWLQGGSRNLTMITATQKPAYVPSAAFDQPRYQFIFHVIDKRSLDRLGEISGDTEMIQGTVPHLGRHEFLWIDTWAGGEMAISKVSV